jgi:hypothetical protein
MDGERFGDIWMAGARGAGDRSTAMGIVGSAGGGRALRQKTRSYGLVGLS